MQISVKSNLPVEQNSTGREKSSTERPVEQKSTGKITGNFYRNIASLYPLRHIQAVSFLLRESMVSENLCIIV